MKENPFLLWFVAHEITIFFIFFAKLLSEKLDIVSLEINDLYFTFESKTSTVIISLL